ncbi:PREDICTED: adenylate kinase isoenzyme 1-like [Habropoda laboriosa]|uniref:adenylate kinase isoenzyme 1-like n=1 Tax=Habropoda laboriosa TaxID=597456 RepID=UPI00083D911D|nr:PREDICTED: adenylate kinase isoenzyme 1-like [Habropoda laboriosa]
MGNCFDKDQEHRIPLGDRVDPAPLKSSESLIIFVVGGPGVGKSTLCKKLMTKYGLILVWVSNILREEVATDSERGQLFKAIMERGENVPAEVIVQLVVRKMLQYPHAYGYLIVGFPRDKKQAVLFNTEVRSPNLLLNLYARRGAIAPNKNVTKVIDAETTVDEVYREACRIIDELVKKSKR